MKIFKTHVVLGVISGVMTAALVFASLLLANHQPAVVIVEATAIQQRVIYMRDRINIVYNAHRYEDCDTKTVRYIWTWEEIDGERIKLFVPLSPSTTDVSILSAGETAKFIVSYRVPPNIWDGQWYFWSKTSNTCSLLKFFQVTSFLIVKSDEPLTIEGRGGASAPDKKFGMEQLKFSDPY